MASPLPAVDMSSRNCCSEDLFPAGLAVLVVEDDAAVRASLVAGLEASGFRVIGVKNGMGALARLKTESVDWVITDIVMPDMDGLELLRQLQNSHPLIRTIAISGGGRMGSAPDYLHIAGMLGARHLLEKPFSFEVPAALIRGTSPAVRRI